MQVNVRVRQLAAVERMLRLDAPGGGRAGGGPARGGAEPAGLAQQQWKVLVYDAFCRDVISPLITVGRLRENGVTLHMLIDAPRESIPDVPAVYFMQPTQENVRRFVQDCQKQLYDSAYLNFSAPLSRELMDLLARSLVEINAVNVVAKVYDQYLGFVSLEPRLFTLNMHDSFARYSQPRVDNATVEGCMDEVCRGLTSMVATLGAVPVIRCPPGGPAEMVARKVCDALRDLAEQQNSFFSSNSRGVLEQRPMLLILDRSVDLTTPLVHTSCYQTLVDDLLEFGLNRVKIPPSTTTDGQGNVVPSNEPAKVVTLDKDSDSFWAEHAGSMIPVAVEAHQKELQAVEEQENAIKRHTGQDPASLAAQNAGGTTALLSTVQSLPALLEKKRFLERHLSVLKATMAIIKARQVHRFVEPEEGMVFSKYAEKQAVKELVSDAACKLEDKVRLFSVYLLTCNPSQQDSDELENAMMSSSAGEAIDEADREGLLKSLRYVKKILSLSRFGKGGAAPDSPAHRGGAAGGAGALWDFAGLTRTAIQNASRQVKSIVGEARVLTSVRMMHLACKEATSEAQVAEQDGQLMYLDPKVRGEVAPAARIRSAFSRGVLFVVGGGCFAEHQNLQDFAAGRLALSGASAALRLGQETASGSMAGNKDTQFIYGCSELVNARQFMRQLAQCE